jgi:hypothetical protein
MSNLTGPGPRGNRVKELSPICNPDELPDEQWEKPEPLLLPHNLHIERPNKDHRT